MERKGNILLKITLVALFVNVFSFTLLAQSASEKISEIKKQGDKYWYSESTGADENATLEKAKIFLADVVRSSFKGDDPEKLFAKAQGIAAGAQYVVASRGPLKRVFVYVEKTEGGVKDSTIKPENEPENKPENKPENEEEAIVIDLGEVKVAEEQKVEVPQISDFEQEILNVGSASEIESFLKTKKANGEITGFGRLKTMPSSGDLYLFIFNPQGEIEACLKRDKGEIKRIDNGNHCAISDYKGCGAIWFK